MTTVTLTGIQIGSPLGFMAALGLLRVLHEDHGLDVNLRWQDGRAVLGGIDTHALLALLAAHMRGRQQAPEFNFEVGTGSGKPVPVVHLREIRPEDYRRAAATLADNSRALGFLAGFATDAVVTDKGFIARTAFDFSSARQELGKEFRNLAARLDPDRKRGRKEAPVEALWTHGLFGGPYAEQHSFGWDPATLMGHGQAAASLWHNPASSGWPSSPCRGTPCCPMATAAPGPLAGRTDRPTPGRNGAPRSAPQKCVCCAPARCHPCYSCPASPACGPPSAPMSENSVSSCPPREP